LAFSTIFKAAANKGGEKVIQIFTGRSVPQLMAVLEEYKKVIFNSC
jgi:hypothetical protein